MHTHALVVWVCVAQFVNVWGNDGADYLDIPKLKYKINPSPANQRCGVCPTYFQKICAFDDYTNSTFIFDNHCIMDVYNCIEGTDFVRMNYEHCIYFGNFAYVHGFKWEQVDYGEDHIIVKGSKKNPDFMRRLSELNEDFFDFY